MKTRTIMRRRDIVCRNEKNSCIRGAGAIVSVRSERTDVVHTLQLSPIAGGVTPSYFYALSEYVSTLIGDTRDAAAPAPMSSLLRRRDDLAAQCFGRVAIARKVGSGSMTGARRLRASWRVAARCPAEVFASALRFMPEGRTYRFEVRRRSDRCWRGWRAYQLGSRPQRDSNPCFGLERAAESFQDPASFHKPCVATIWPACPVSRYARENPSLST